MIDGNRAVGVSRNRKFISRTIIIHLLEIIRPLVCVISQAAIEPLDARLSRNNVIPGRAVNDIIIVQAERWQPVGRCNRLVDRVVLASP